ncbi:hypothetical protein B0H13DRAFT_1907177 [Mycena leptocephala]|nr:hypothetical protein B0H13DRAFT_1907177 [Mycena leptocephala]
MVFPVMALWAPMGAHRQLKYNGSLLLLAFFSVSSSRNRPCLKFLPCPSTTASANDSDFSVFNDNPGFQAFLSHQYQQFLLHLSPVSGPNPIITNPTSAPTSVQQQMGPVRPAAWPMFPAMAAPQMMSQPNPSLPIHDHYQSARSIPRPQNHAMVAPASYGPFLGASALAPLAATLNTSHVNHHRLASAADSLPRCANVNHRIAASAVALRVRLAARLRQWGIPTIPSVQLVWLPVFGPTPTELDPDSKHVHVAFQTLRVDFTNWLPSVGLIFSYALAEDSRVQDLCSASSQMSEPSHTSSLRRIAGVRQMMRKFVSLRNFMTITAQKIRQVSVQLLPTALIQSHEFMICRSAETVLRSREFF